MSVNEVKLKQTVIDFEVRGTGHPGSRTFVLGNEDHTLGNALRHVLIQNAKVACSGYSVPHPSEPLVHIRVQTTKNSKRRGSTNNRDDPQENRAHATEVLKEACQTLMAQCDFILEKVEEIMPEVKEDRLSLEKYFEADGYRNDEDEEMEALNEEGGEDDEMIDDL